MEVLTKRGSRREALNEIVMKNRFRHAQTRDNWVYYKNGDFKKRNLVTKKQKQEQWGRTVKLKNQLGGIYLCKSIDGQQEIVEILNID